MKVKLLSVVTSIVLLMLTVYPSIQAEASTDPMQQNKVINTEEYEIKFLVDKERFQKIKFTNKQTGEVEFLERKQKGEKNIYIATDRNGRTQTYEEKSLSELNLGEKNYESSGPSIMTSWIYGWTSKGSSSISATSISAVAGIFASIAGGPVTGVLTTAAATWLSLDVDEVWYKLSYYTDADDYCHQQKVTVFYGYPDYTNYLATEFNDWYAC
ncbi:hypothetical protein [Thalassobacillus devorans]|uniref:hypothetical protein n=1 Tax=Thalassobacillus devorans TaxID=279813 RepID=UPI000A1CCA6E|nr:hypothetical protein [Thalassobacillus devorans]